MKKIKEELADFATNMSENAPEEALQLIGEEIGKLSQSGLVEKALKVGDRAPDFSLKDTGGSEISLSELLSNGPVLISFNRGNWCPFCNIEFKHLQNTEAVIRNAGANMIVITPQLPEKSLELKTENGYNYPILYDEDNAVAKEFGIAFALPESLRPIHIAFGMDIPAHSGNESYELPIPATYVINQDGIITYSHINANWMDRGDTEDYINQIQLEQAV